MDHIIGIEFLVAFAAPPIVNGAFAYPPFGRKMFCHLIRNFDIGQPINPSENKSAQLCVLIQLDLPTGTMFAAMICHRNIARWQGIRDPVKGRFQSRPVLGFGNDARMLSNSALPAYAVAPLPNSGVANADPFAGDVVLQSFKTLNLAPLILLLCPFRYFATVTSVIRKRRAIAAFERPCA